MLPENIAMRAKAVDQRRFQGTQGLFKILEQGGWTVKSRNSEQVQERRVTGKGFWILLLVFLVVLLLGLFLILMQREKPSPKPSLSAWKADVVKQMIVVPVVEPLDATPEKTPIPEPPATPAPTPPPPAPPKPQRVYEVKQGECLWGIAARPEVYNKPEMWTALYRANPGVVDYYYQKDGAPFVIINPGVRLRILEPQEVQKLQAAVPKKLWILQLSVNRNIRFALTFAASLKGLGSVVYVMEDTLGGQPCYRVRMGFFADKEKARVMAGKVTKRTGHPEYSILSASRSEMETHLPFPEMQSTLSES